MEKTDKELLQSYKIDWNKFICEWLGLRLDRKQRQIIEAIQHNKRVSVRSGHARGKDYLAAVASVCFLYLNEPSKVINTAPTGRQVTSIMMSEIGKIHNNAKIPLGGEVLASKIKIPGYPEWFLEGFKASDKATEAWTGFHSPNIMVVVTEASGVSQETNNAIEGLLTGNSKLLLIFNPNQMEGESYKSTKDPRYKRFRLSCLDAPNVRAKKQLIPGQVDYEWVEDKVNKWCMQIEESEVRKDLYDFKFNGKWYRPNDLFRPKVMGEYPGESSNQLIPIAWIEAAQARWENRKRPEAQLKLGVDVAGMGRDATVFCYRYGTYVEKYDMYSKQDHMVTAGQVKNKIGSGTAYLDTIGEGAGVHSRLIEQGVNSVSAKFSEGTDLQDYTGELIFANMRAYCYWALRDALNPQFNSDFVLPDCDELVQDLTEPTYSFRSNGSIIIEPKEDIKERLGRSPDWGDSLALTFYPDNAPPAMASIDPEPVIKRRRW